MSLTRFLTHGYFPHELPQSFSSISFGEMIGELVDTNSLPRDLSELIDRQNSRRTARLIKHNLARVNKFRRVLGIPNPILYIGLCKEIIDNWVEIENFINRSPLSYTKPAISNNGNRAFSDKSLLRDRPQIRAQFRSNGKYLLVTDIQQFYPSIYTHSLSWALHTKTVAKVKRNDMSFLGNRLDKFARGMQDSQTMGLPIGPDSSRILSEILLTAVDIELINKLPNLKGFRRVDDYELTFRSRSEAENALGTLQGILSDFELSLNESKTQILELPLPLEETWRFTFKDFNFDFDNKRPLDRIKDLTIYFGLAFETALKYPQDSVIAYGISRMKKENVVKATEDKMVWKFYQNLLIQSMIAEPGVIRYALFELKKYMDRGLLIDKDKIQDALEQIIQFHYSLGHESEVAWAIWAAIILETKLSELSSNYISQNRDSLVPLLALHAESINLTSVPLDRTYWSSLMTEDELWGNNWLLCYEANLKGWLPSVGGVDHVNRNSYFSILKQKNVSFYDTRAVNLDHPQWQSRFSITELLGYTSSEIEDM